MEWTKPDIKVEPPGPKSQAFIKRDSEIMSKSLSRARTRRLNFDIWFFPFHFQFHLKTRETKFDLEEELN